MKITIVRIGSVDRSIVEVTGTGLCEVFSNTDCTIFEVVMPIPIGACNSMKRQHHSSFILAKIGDHVEQYNTDYVSGVVDVDLYVPSLNFVF